MALHSHRLLAVTGARSKTHACCAAYWPNPSRISQFDTRLISASPPSLRESMSFSKQPSKIVAWDTGVSILPIPVNAVSGVITWTSKRSSKV